MVTVCLGLKRTRRIDGGQVGAMGDSYVRPTG